MKVLVIVPAYNEQENIKRVVEELQTNFPQYDYVVVNDGSKDNTARICHKNGYRILDLPINLGLSGAFATGMYFAWKNGYDVAVQLDADGQHLPCYIPAMVEQIRQGCHIVIGSRFAAKKKPASFRMMGSNLISKMIFWTTGTYLTDPTSGMRAYNAPIIREFALEINCTPEPDTISYLIQRDAVVKEVPVEMKERMAGESYLNWSNSIRYMIHMCISILFIQPFRGGTTLGTPCKEG